MKKSRIISAQVMTPTETLFLGNVLSLTSTNHAGDFTILSEHINFISLIKERIVLQLENLETKKIPIEFGILRYQDNKAEIFTGLSQLSAVKAP